MWILCVFDCRNGFCETNNGCSNDTLVCIYIYMQTERHSQAYTHTVIHSVSSLICFRCYCFVKFSRYNFVFHMKIKWKIEWMERLFYVAANLLFVSIVCGSFRPITVICLYDSRLKESFFFSCLYLCHFQPNIRNGWWWIPSNYIFVIKFHILPRVHALLHRNRFESEINRFGSNRELCHFSFSIRWLVIMNGSRFHLSDFHVLIIA